MKKRLFFLSMIASVSFLSSAFSVLDTDLFDTEYMEQPKAKGPFTFQADADFIGKSDFTKRGYKNQNLSFYQWEAAFEAVYYYNPCYKEGANIGIEYSRFNLDWKQNPYFHQEEFNNVSLSLGFASERVCGWLWRALVTANVDADHWDFNHYLDFDAVLWGRYSLCHNVGFHCGFYGNYGMLVDKIYPMIGFDWKYNYRWHFNVIFPQNLSVVYTVNENFTVAIANRFFNVIERTGKNEPLRMAIWEYRNNGIELGLSYDSCHISANVHGGYTTGGLLKISNNHHRDSQRFKFESAPYAGAEVLLNF